MPPQKKRLVVVGGGIAGLAALYRLQELSLKLNVEERPSLLLLEAGDKLGGSIHTIKENDCLIELGPDSFITQKPWALDLCKRLELMDSIIPTKENFRRTFVVSNGKLHPLPEGFMMLAPTKWMPFAQSSIFSPLGKLRMALDLMIPKRNLNSDESLSSFVIRRLGKEALEKIAQPMIGGIYTADPDKLSLKATMPKFIEYEQKYGSVIRGMMQEHKNKHDEIEAGKMPALPDKMLPGKILPGNALPGQITVGADVIHPVAGARYSLFVSFEQGMQTLIDRLVEKLPAKSLYFNCQVSKVMEKDGAWVLLLPNGERIDADGIVMATPSYVTAKLLSGLNSQLTQNLEKIEYATSATVNFIYNRSDIKHSLDGFGFVVPAIEKMSIIACTFSSVKFAQRAPQDKVVLRTFLGGALNTKINQTSNDKLIEFAKADLKKLLTISGEPVFSIVSRYPHSMPQYYVGHLDLIANINKQIAKYNGLALAGNAYSGVGIPDCIHSGEIAAESIF